MRSPSSNASSWSCVMKMAGTLTCPEQRAYLAAEPDARLRVERAEGLVEEQDLRLVGERARDGHALLLPARELRGELLAVLLEVDEFEQVVDLLFDFAPLPAAYAQPVADVLLDGHAREERVGLEDDADAALARGQLRHVAAVEDDAPRVGLLQPGDDAQDAWSCRSPTRRAGRAPRPRATSKLTSSSTRAPLKLLLTPRTLAAATAGTSAGDARAPRRRAAHRRRRRRQSAAIFSGSSHVGHLTRFRASRARRRGC